MPFVLPGDIAAPTIMDWLLNFWKKLPTLKGIIWFFHVAANWSTFREELELYRQQIKDRDEWRRTQTEIHEAEKQRMTREFEQKVQMAGVALKGILEYEVRLRMESTLRLAIHYQLNPLEWSRERENMQPALREAIEKWMRRAAATATAAENTSRNIYQRTCWNEMMEL